MVIRRIARIHCRAGSTDGRAQLIGHAFNNGEVFRRTHGAPARDHNPRRRQFRAFAFDNLGAQEARKPRIGRGRRRFNRRRTTFGRHGIEGSSTYRDHLLRIGGFHGSHRVAGIDGPHKGIGIHHVRNVRENLHIQKCCGARHHILATSGSRRQQMRIAGGECHQQSGHGLGQAMGVDVSLGGQHFRH